MANLSQYDGGMMDNHFFALFGLPVQFEIDKKILKDKLLELQKQHHPDRQDDASTHAQKQAELINHAYEILHQDDTRAAYLLELSGQALDLNQSISDWDFLDEMMELRISLDELQESSALNALINDVQQRIDEQAKMFANHYAQQHWQAAKDDAKKLQFLSKLQQDIHAKNSQSLASNDGDDDLYV